MNVVPFLEMIGLPESVVDLLRESSSGYAITAYAMYKVTFLQELLSAHEWYCLSVYSPSSFIVKLPDLCNNHIGIPGRRTFKK